MAAIIPNDAELSKEIYEYLTKDQDFDLSSLVLPEQLLTALKNAPEQITNDSLTNTTFDKSDTERGFKRGTGTVDAVLESIKAHLRVEFDAQRIQGKDYAEAFIQLISAGLQTASQFLIQRDQAYWGAVTAQINAATAAIGLQTQKMQYLLVKAQYATEVMKLALSDAQYRQVEKQIGSLTLKDTLDTNKDKREEQTTTAQVALFGQQKESFKRKDEHDLIKLAADAWNTQKGMDEGTVPPNSWTNTKIDTMYTKALTLVGLT